MSSGIYQLKFGRDTYIGKSNNISRRWDEHLKKLTEGKAAKKVQDAYNKHGVPEAVILMYCHPDHIDLMESILVRTLRPTLNVASTSSIDSDEDFNTLYEAEEDILSISTAAHIRIIDSLKTSNKLLLERIELLESESDSAARIKTLEALVNRVRPVDNRSWWSKIFG